MRNNNDGKQSTTKNSGQALRTVTDKIQQLQETGIFTSEEQKLINDLKKAVKNQGGLGNIEVSDVNELIDVIKVLGSEGDKCEMVGGQVKDLLKNISKRTK